jgi:putative membrane protein insertion efficiency factor
MAETTLPVFRTLGRTSVPVAAETAAATPMTQMIPLIPVTPANPVIVARRGGRRWQRFIVPLALLCLLGIDLGRPPATQASARLLLGGIHLYQATLSPRLGALGVQCRFQPTCSHYAEGAIARHGALSGSLRAAWRIARCGPWTRAGTYDPP